MGAPLQLRHLQTGSGERRHHVEGGANLRGAAGKTHLHAQPHVKHTAMNLITLKESTSGQTTRLLMLFEQSFSVKAVVCPL